MLLRIGDTVLHPAPCGPTQEARQIAITEIFFNTALLRKTKRTILEREFLEKTAAPSTENSWYLTVVIPSKVSK